MSDQQNADATGSGASEQTPPAQPVAPPAAAPEPVAAAPQAPPTDVPAWFPKRAKELQASARKEVLSAAGVDSVEALTAKLEQLKQLELAQLSDKERSERLIQELTPKAAELDAVKAQFAEVVNAQLAQVPEQVRASIEAAAGDNVQERWKLMQVMSSAGVLNAPAVAAAPKPASTTPQQQPPAPVQPSNERTEWDRIKHQPGITDPLVGASSIAGQLHFMRHADVLGRDPTQG